MRVQTRCLTCCAAAVFGTLLLAPIAHADGPATAPKTQPAGPPLRVLVDPRVELLSLVFRLAGNDEYNRCRVDSYNKDVEKHFGVFRNHPVVALARELRNRSSVSFDAVMSMAGHITDTTNIRERVPFDPLPRTLDNRWTTKSARDFLKQLRAFVLDSDFNGFFEQHKALYDVATARVQEMLRTHAHLEWFDTFFGPRKGADFIIAIGMLNGPSNYGVSCRTASGEQLFCVLGVWNTDREGLPVFPKSVLPTVVHEFTHSYANPLIDAHLKELRGAGEKLFPLVAPAMRRQAYGSWQTMMRESLVRACVIRYVRRYDGGLTAATETLDQRTRSFLWMSELALLLGDYEAHRAQYPTLSAFMPRIITFFNDYARKATSQPGK